MVSMTKALAASGLFGAVVVSAIALSNAEARPPEQTPARTGIVVKLVGIGEAEVRDVSAYTDADGADVALCFDIQMVDPTSGRVLGTATDCIMDIQEVGDGLSMSSVTMFHFASGSVISIGEVTVQPTTIGSPNITHITGSIPTGDTNSIVAGTGAFRHASGPVRVSGAVDLSRFGDGIITFDCLFVLNFD